MSTPTLVQQFYERIWNAGEEGAAAALLAEDFVFRGSLGSSTRGREAFLDYVRSVRGSLAEYRCDILECVSENERAFARMRFSGRHVGSFRGYSPSGKLVEWSGAALFSFDKDVIAELWVLGDLYGLDGVLRANAGS